MISVTPIQEKTMQERLCALCKIPYRAELLAYAAYNDQKAFVGICQFGLAPDGGHIHHLEIPGKEDTDDALFVMGRAANAF